MVSGHRIDRWRINVETHGEVFTWVLKQLAQAGLVQGKTIGIDATTLEANAAMRSLVHRDTGKDYETFVRGLAKSSGVETPTREELVRFDRKRKKKTSNREWVNPHDPDAKITKMKDGRTRLGHKVEEAVDLETGAVLERASESLVSRDDIPGGELGSGAPGGAGGAGATGGVVPGSLLGNRMVGVVCLDRRGAMVENTEWVETLIPPIGGARGIRVH